MRRKPGRRMKDMAKRGIVGLLTVSMCLSHVQGIAFADNRVEVGDVEVDGKKITLSLSGDSIMDAAKAAFEDAHLYENEYLGVSKDAKTQAAYRALTDGTNPLYEMNLFSEEEVQALEDAGVEVKALIQMDQEQAEAEGNLKPATESNALRATEEENTQLVVFDPKKEGKKDLLLYKQDSLFANFYDQFSNQLMNQTTTEITAADPASYEINGDEKVTFILMNHADDSRTLNLKLNDATLEKGIKLMQAETVIKGVMGTLDEKGIDDTTEPASPSVVPTQEETTADSTTADANASTDAATEAAATTDAAEANAETQLPAESETIAAATETLPQEGQIESENVKSEATEATPEQKTIVETVKENLAQVVKTVKETITAVEETLGVIHSEAAENEGFATESELEKETTAPAETTVAATEEKKETAKTDMDTALENERKDLLKNTKPSELVDSSVASAKVLQYTLDDLSKAYWSAEIEGEYEVNVFAEKTAFDADDHVKLQLKKLDKPEEAEDGTLATSDDTLTKEQVDALKADGSYENSQSIDISFVDEDGKEVEPKTPVKVKIKVYKEALPEDADISTMVIKHLDESTGSVQAATVASYGETANGAIKAVDEQGKKVELKSVDADTTEVADEEVEAASVATAATKEVLPEDAVGVESTFTVKSFSSFTITFGSKAFKGTFTIMYVDPKYNELEYTMPANLSQASEIDFDNKNTFGKDIKKKIGDDFRTYELYDVKIVRPWQRKEDGQTIERRLVKINDTTILGNPKIRWQYTIQNGDTIDFGSGDTIYVMYKEKLEEVDTVPMPSGFHLYMQNYNGPANIGSEYRPNAWTGLYSEKIPDNQEFPTLNKNGESLGQYYQNAIPVDGLFVRQKEGSQNDGYLYYNCEENFATLELDENGTHGNFHVYKQLGTPSDENQWYFHRGNFLPYNQLDTTKIWNSNRYKTSQKDMIPPNDPRYDENLYGLEGLNGYDKNMDGFYFGAYGKADFYQPENGLVNGKPMVYEFIGDDDLVVYIDGILVLDLGGIHDALSGSINFATGKIECTGNDANNNTYLFDKLQKYGVGIKDGKPDNDFWKPITTDNRTTYVFQDNSKHSIKFFYMERGAGASNLKLKINIPPIPDGSLQIKKEVKGLNLDQAKNEKYYFQLFDEKDKPISVLSYTVGKDTRYPDKNGYIWIRDGERAQITDLPIGHDVKVKEVTTSPIYTTQYESTDSNGNTITPDNDGIKVRIPPANSIEVKVTNTVKPEYAKKLTVNKNFNVNDDISSDPDTSLIGGDYNNIEFILKEKTVDETGATKYTPVGDPVRFEKFTPNANKTSASYEFENLDSTKTYVVEEKRASAKLDGGTEDKPYSKTGYQIDETDTNGNITWDDSNSTSTSTSEFRLTNAKTVTFTNVYETPSINVQFYKVDKDKEGNHLKDAKFKLTKKNGDSYITVKDASGDDVVVSDDTVINLSTGEYQLTETEAPAGYNLLTGTVDFKIENRRVAEIRTDTSVSSEMYKIESKGTSNVVTIKNKAGAALPVTGGTGTILFNLGGMALMLIALGYVIMKRREEGAITR